MRRAPEAHARYRALISERLDGLLDAQRNAELDEHLQTCGRCRRVDRDFRDQQQQLRAWTAPPPPRDLWARTSTALDRSTAVQHRHTTLLNPSPRSPRTLAVASLVGLGVMVALVTAQLQAVWDASLQRQSRATPFTVPTQQLAFVRHESGVLALYQTSVGSMCPAQALDCIETVFARRGLVPIPGDLTPRQIAATDAGSRVAVIGRSDDQDMVLILAMPSRPTGAGSSLEDPSSSPGVSSASPSSSGAAGSDTITTPSLHPVTPTPTVTTSADVSDDPTGLSPTPHRSATASPMPSFATGLGPVNVGHQTIIDEVFVLGSSPSWSPDGTMLAFSAMPADRSNGPDLYVWRSGDRAATRLTDDHASYFASWSGKRIVISRLTGLRDGAWTTETVVMDPVTQQERVVVADEMWLPVVAPDQRRAIAWKGLLAHANGGVRPTQGQLYLLDWEAIDPFAERGRNDATPRPGSPSDPSTSPRPEGPGDESDDVGEGTADRHPATSGPGMPTTSGPGMPATSPDATTSIVPTPSAPSPRRSTDSAPQEAPPPNRGTRTPVASLDVRETDPAGRPTASPEESLDPRASEDSEDPSDERAGRSTPLERNRDAVRNPVDDWQIRWDQDGQAVGYWIAESRGSVWGRLTVVAVNDGAISRPEPLLGPTLAQRAFTMGDERIAWVAPATEGTMDGELRIRSWGSGGSGTIRIRNVQISEGAPAF